MKWGDEFSIELHNPLTSEEWAMICDYELDNTTEITFHTPKGKDVKFVKPINCKDCKYFEYDHFANVGGIPLIVAHEICTRWGNGVKTSEDGYCFLAERRTDG